MELFDADIIDLDNLDELLEQRKSDNIMEQALAEVALSEHSLTARAKKKAYKAYKADLDAYYEALATWNRECVCKRCNGDGVINAYKHVDNGICFRCGGSKVDPDAPLKPVKPTRPE